MSNPATDAPARRRRRSGIAGVAVTALTAAALAGASPAAIAAFAQDDVTGTIGAVDPPGTLDRPGGFISALAGWASGGGPGPGPDPATAFVLGPHVVEDPFVEDATGSAAAMFPPAGPAQSTEAWANGTARLGSVSVAGRAQQVFDLANESAGTSIAHGGWVDTITITTPGNPGLQGEQAIWLFEIDVNNAFDASGFNGLGAFQVKPFVDRQALPSSNPGYDGGTFNIAAAAFQQSLWRLVFQNIGGGSDSIGVVDTATYAAEITIGTPFDLGIFALGWAQAATSDAFPIGSIGEYDSDAVWGGSAGLTTLAGAPIAGFQVTALSGTDWEPAMVIPVPGVGWLAALAAGLLLGRKRRCP